MANAIPVHSNKGKKTDVKESVVVPEVQSIEVPGQPEVAVPSAPVKLANHDAYRVDN